ncbi:hypothetical protein ACIOEX_19815, partial [Streptomyces sp. NPDC087850]|uniref:hypothetical protein n=1 Tax=Streptomyces sp. NPDC087850 TaxID=3365809 RepID=UPI0037F7202D
SGEKIWPYAGKPVAINCAVFGRTRGAYGDRRQQRLLTALGSLLLPDEVKEWGRVYRESVTSGTVTAVPRSITGRAVTAGYSLADLKSDLPAVAQEYAGLPNAQRAGREVLAAGASADGRAFLDALRTYGGGASVVGGSGVAPNRSSAAFRVRLDLESFFVHEPVGDQWASKDETYWCASVSSDIVAGGGYVSQEFGSVEEGETHYFGSNGKIFDGDARTGVIIYLSCWEADQSPQQWYRDLQLALNALSDSWLNTWQWELVSGVVDFGVLGYLADLLSLGQFLMEAYRNDDDKSCERVIALDQYDLAVLSRLGSSGWGFKGLGHHELKIKHSGDPVPFPTGTLEYTVRDAAGTWGVPITLGWESQSSPALASFQNRLHAVFIRPGDQAVMWSRLESGAWTTPERISDWRSLYPPALAVFDGKLHCVHTRSNGELWWSTHTGGTSWSQPRRAGNGTAHLGPSLAAGPNELWMSHNETSGSLRTSLLRKGSRDWEGAWADNLGWSLQNPAVLAWHNGRPWRLARGTANSMHVCNGHLTSQNIPAYGDNRVIGAWTSTKSPGLASHSGKLWLLINGYGDGILRWSTGGGSHNGEWTHPEQIGSQPIKPMGEVAAASHTDRLYVMYRR